MSLRPDRIQNVNARGRTIPSWLPPQLTRSPVWTSWMTFGPGTSRCETRHRVRGLGGQVLLEGPDVRRAL